LKKANYNPYKNKMKVGGEKKMERVEKESKEQKGQGNIRLIQMLYDDIFLMFLLGIVVPALTYTIWGLIEIALKQISP
jgi:hypothetical protein